LLKLISGHLILSEKYFCQNPEKYENYSFNAFKVLLSSLDILLASKLHGYV
jgi:hypothetical protein